MKNKISRLWRPWLMAVNAAAVVWLCGCATPKDHSFNADFGEKLPTHPMYSIEDKESDHFKITVRQGTPSNGGERIENVKEAATTVAKAETKRRGWEKWQLDYIQERNQGWMHIVIAEVKRR
jgi:hypothetical protein